MYVDFEYSKIYGATHISLKYKKNAIKVSDDITHGLLLYSNSANRLVEYYNTCRYVQFYFCKNALVPPFV